MVDFGIIARILGVLLALGGFGLILVEVFNSFNMLAIILGAVFLAIGIVVAKAFTE